MAGKVDNREIIRKAFIFSRLTDDEVDKLASIAKTEKYRSGDVIFKEGAEGGNLYIVAEGKVKLLKRLDDNTDATLAEIDNNEFFGEVSLFDQKPQVVTAVSMTDTTLISLDYPSLRGLLILYPEMAKKVYSQVLRLQSNLLRETNERIKKFLQKATGG
ncbi:MAG: Crp/Fnr family transcriptional regulator [bacterium]